MKNLTDEPYAGLRRNRRNPARIAEVKAQVRQCILADSTLKTTGLTVGVSNATACYWACVLGFRRMFVTREERAHLMARRAEGGT